MKDNLVKIVNYLLNIDSLSNRKRGRKIGQKKTYEPKKNYAYQNKYATRKTKKDDEDDGKKQKEKEMFPRQVSQPSLMNMNVPFKVMPAQAAQMSQQK